jgi:hypothetical protein
MLRLSSLARHIPLRALTSYAHRSTLLIPSCLALILTSSDKPDKPSRRSPLVCSNTRTLSIKPFSNPFKVDQRWTGSLTLTFIPFPFYLLCTLKFPCSFLHSTFLFSFNYLALSIAPIPYFCFGRIARPFSPGHTLGHQPYFLASCYCYAGLGRLALFHLPFQSYLSLGLWFS